MDWTYLLEELKKAVQHAQTSFFFDNNLQDNGVMLHTDASDNGGRGVITFVQFSHRATIEKNHQDLQQNSTKRKLWTPKGRDLRA